MIKRGWKLPNPSHFTYTSIVQPILQANNPFYTVFEPFYPRNWHFTLQKPRFEIAIFNPILGPILGRSPPYRVYCGPMGPQWPHPSHFTSKQPILHSFCLISMTTLHFPAWCSSAWLLPATGLFWSRLSALETHTNVFSTHLWSFWYQIHLNQTLRSILKLQKIAF